MHILKTWKNRLNHFFAKNCINIKSSIQYPHREIRMFCIIKWSWILFVKAETRWFGAMGWVSSYFQIYHILKILRCKRVKSTSYVVTYVSWLVGETYRIDLLQTKYLSWLLNTLPNFFHLDSISYNLPIMTEFANI